MRREFTLESLAFDTYAGPFTLKARGRLETYTGPTDFHPGRLSIDAAISDSLHAKIRRLVEEEIGALLNAAPTGTGEPPSDDEVPY